MIERFFEDFLVKNQALMWLDKLIIVHNDIDEFAFKLYFERLAKLINEYF